MIINSAEQEMKYYLEQKRQQQEQTIRQEELNTHRKTIEKDGKKQIQLLQEMIEKTNKQAKTAQCISRISITIGITSLIISIISLL